TQDFNMNPGGAVTKGLFGTQPNLSAPCMRMLSAMAPLIVLKDGKTIPVTGRPAAPTKINTVLRIFVEVVAFKMDIEAAPDEPRIHHQWMPDTLTMERGLADLQSPLEAMGHTIRLGASQGDAQSILIKDGKKCPGVDHRTRGGAAGY